MASTLLKVANSFTYDSWLVMPDQLKKLHHETEQRICGHRLSVTLTDLPRDLMAEHRDWETQTFTARNAARNGYTVFQLNLQWIDPFNMELKNACSADYVMKDGFDYAGNVLLERMNGGCLVGVAWVSIEFDLKQKFLLLCCWSSGSEAFGVLCASGKRPTRG